MFSKERGGLAGGLTAARGHERERGEHEVALVAMHAKCGAVSRRGPLGRCRRDERGGAWRPVDSAGRRGAWRDAEEKGGGGPGGRVAAGPPLPFFKKKN